jgi:sulfur carrier protein
MTIKISLNGDKLVVDASSLQGLLVARGYQLETAFACAVNHAFVPRAKWPSLTLENGDRIDVVTPITGG